MGRPYLLPPLKDTILKYVVDIINRKERRERREKKKGGRGERKRRGRVSKPSRFWNLMNPIILSVPLPHKIL